MRVYGELVGFLWEEDDTAAAVELERMWNELLDEEPLTLFCAYPTPHSPHHLQAIRRICGSHSAVVPSLVAGEPQSAGAALDVEFSPDLESPRRARALLRSALDELQLSEDLIERGMLAASELAANAVVHAKTPFRLVVQPKASSVWIGVEDRAPLRDRGEVIGRVPHGLGLVAALALRWGVTPCETGKLVWAELPSEPMPPVPQG
jgi:anti-sigma regulatory factor (Ser/Thr protein kinase)